MVDSSVLTQLKDIHWPAAIGFWPPAPGWFIVFALLVMGLVGIVCWLLYRTKQQRIKKQALALLAAYEAQYARDNEAQLASARISELLKRVALVYFPRQEVASMHGHQWVAFLQHTSKGIDFAALQVLILESPFKTKEALSAQPLFEAARRWIQQRKKPCLN